jgi:hypothetical protein
MRNSFPAAVVTLSEPQAEYAIYDSGRGISRVVGDDVVPDETTTVAKYSDF